MMSSRSSILDPLAFPARLPISPPVWPLTVEHGHPQSEHLLWWYKAQLFPRDSLRDIGIRRASATGVNISASDYARHDLVGAYVDLDGATEYYSTPIADTDIPSLANWGFGGWVRPDDISSTGANAWELDGVIADTSEFFGMVVGNLDAAGDGVYFYNWDGAEQVTGPHTVTVGQWVHLFWRLAFGNLEGYLNGQLVGSVSSGGTDLGAASTMVQLGRMGSARYFDGGFAEARFYSPAPNAAMIEQLYQPWTRWQALSEPGIPMDHPSAALKRLRMMLGFGD